MRFQSFRKFRRPSRRPSRASGLLIAMGFVLVISVVVGMVVSATSQNTRETWRTAVVENSLAGARAVASGMAHNTLFIARSLPPQLSGVVEEMDDLILSMAPVVPRGYELAQTPEGEDLAFLRDLGPNDFNYAYIDDENDEWFGYSTARLDWDVHAVVREDSRRAEHFDYRGAGMKKRVTIDYIPLYQFAIFYEGDLELHPGPAMDVRGRVHTNQDLYLSAVNDLKIHERVTTAGYFYRWTYENGQNADIFIKDNNGVFRGMKGDNNPNDGNDWLDSLDENWLPESIDRWAGGLRDAHHGILPINPPLPPGAETMTMVQRAAAGDDPALASVKFENKADLLILGDPGQPSTINGYIRDSDGELVAINQQYVTPGHPNSFISIGEFFDGQQMTVVKTLDLDMGKLNSSGVADFSAGSGIVYLSTTPSDVDPDPWSPSSTDPVWKRDANGNIIFNSNGLPQIEPGQEGWWNPSPDPRQPGTANFLPAVRVLNAGTLPANSSNGFGLYTDRPLYTVGNINTSNKKTAVFSGDSVTVLSQKLTLQKPQLELNWDGTPRLDWWGNVIPKMTPNNREYLYTSGNTREMGPWVRTHNDYEIPYNWNGDLKPRASHTETNVIFLMGVAPPQFEHHPDYYNENVRTVNGAYNKLLAGSGGAHNVMRYLENWDSRNHNFNGSMIVLWDSDVSAIKWRMNYMLRGRSLNGGQYAFYAPPRRNYNWDNSLQATAPPPGMPIFLEVREGPWERVSYDDAVAAYANRRWSGE